MTNSLFAELFHDSAMLQVFAGQKLIANMLRFEAELAQCQAGCGLIPQAAAEAIATACAQIELSPQDLQASTGSSGVPVPELVRRLRSQLDPESAQYLHWGTTSQDVLDSANAQLWREALDLLATKLAQVIDKLASECQQHGAHLLAGRTRGQIAAPISYGLRLAHWAAPLVELEQQLKPLCNDCLALQLGGSVGSNLAFGDQATALRQSLAQALGLRAATPWHSNRSKISKLAHWLTQLAQALAKIAADSIIMSRNEVAELVNSSGGGSSAMPQKSNPVLAENLVALRHIALGLQSGLNSAALQSEERDGSGWMVEWLLLPKLFDTGATALRHTQSLLATNSFNPEGALANIAANSGIWAERANLELSQRIGRTAASEQIAAALAAPGDFIANLQAQTTHPIDWDTLFNHQQIITHCQAQAREVFGGRGLINN